MAPAFDHAARTGHFIRDWRRYRGMTQNDLAAAVGVDKSYVTKIETGARRYDQQLLESFAIALDCCPADLLLRRPTEPEDIGVIWNELGGRERRRVLAIIRALMIA